MRSTDPAPLRLLRLTELLFQAVLDGMSNKELSAASGYSPTNVSRDMALLRRGGWARQLDNGRWTLSEKPVALLKIYQLHLNRFADRARDFELRAAARARQMLP